MTAELSPTGECASSAPAVVDALYPVEARVTSEAGAQAFRSRAVSALVLVGVLALLVSGAVAAYHAFTDSVVAPIILSPSNDAVIQSKLTLSRVVSERESLQARIEQERVAIEADRRALQLIRALSSPNSAAATEAIEPGMRADHRRANLTVLDQQRAELEQVLRGQEHYVADLERDFASGLVHKADLERERSKLAQARVAVLENQRDVLSGREQLASIGVDDLRSNLELFKIEAEYKGRLAQQAADEDAVARLEELLAQMKDRPIYRATESNQNVAFVPYAQLDGVTPGAGVYQCRLWGFFGCSSVGRVSQVLAGEVISPEPWGGETRGQYALLELTDPEAARSRSLRVRDSTAGSGAVPVKLGANAR